MGVLKGEQFAQLVVETAAPPDAIDRLVARRADDPCARIIRHAGRGPLLERGGKGLLHGVFGEIEVTDQMDQCGQDSRVVGAVETLYGGRGHWENAR